MRWIATFVLATISLQALAEPLHLYVSPTGTDAAPGTAAAPFATLTRARDEIRKQKPHGAIVEIKGGTYPLNDTFTLTPEDSGSGEAPVIYQAAKDETPIFSGGVRIQGWRLDPKGRWQTRVPEVEKGEWNFIQLFVNGQRRFRPRLPKNGYFYIAAETKPTDAAAPHGFDRFQFNPGEIKSNFTGLQDVECLHFSHWFMSRLKVASVDDAAHIVSFTGSTRTNRPYGKLAKGSRYLLENVPDALTDPGEWYLDRKTGNLTYIPLPGEQLDTSEVIAPRLDQLLKIEGDVKSRRFVHHVIFRGLTFRHTNWNTPATGYSSPQAEAPLPGAIRAVGLRDAAFERCTIDHTGMYAIELAAGCKNNRIEHCLLADLGAGGIKIGEQRVNPDAEAIASDNVVRDNLILHGGRVHPAGIGIIVFQSPANLVQHNEIADFYYTAISSGWTWGYAKGLATANQYLDNYVHQIGQGVLSDMGGIYTLGDHAGSVIRGNRFEDIESFTYGGWGIYFDEGTTGILAENNLVIGTRTGGFHQHYGKENTVRNNVFINGKEQWAERTRVEPHLSFTFEQNILIGDQPNVFKGNWKDQVAVDRNLYWCTRGSPQFSGATLEARQQSTRQDLNSLIGDPLLADPLHSDCSLAPGSPAEKLAFKPFNVRAAGLQTRLPSPPPAPNGYPLHPPPAPH